MSETWPTDPLAIPPRLSRGDRSRELRLPRPRAHFLVKTSEIVARLGPPRVIPGIWLREFGTNQVVPTAVLSCVFKAHDLEQAQQGGLTLFWAHALEAMGDFIEATQG